jgi:hypothetical protein
MMEMIQREFLPIPTKIFINCLSWNGALRPSVSANFLGWVDL